MKIQQLYKLSTTNFQHLTTLCSYLSVTLIIIAQITKNRVVPLGYSNEGIKKATPYRCSFYVLLTSKIFDRFTLVQNYNIEDNFTSVVVMFNIKSSIMKRVRTETLVLIKEVVKLAGICLKLFL